MIMTCFAFAVSVLLWWYASAIVTVLGALIVGLSCKFCFSLPCVVTCTLLHWQQQYNGSDIPFFAKYVDFGLI